MLHPVEDCLTGYRARLLVPLPRQISNPILFTIKIKLCLRGIQKLYSSAHKLVMHIGP